MKFADKAIFNILSQASGTIILLLSSVLYVRILSPSEYGTFLQIVLIANLVVLLGFFGLPQSIYYFLQKEPLKDRFLINTLFITAILSVFFAIILFFSKGLLTRFFDNQILSQYYWAVIFIILASFLIQLRQPLLWSHGSLILSGYLTIVASVLQLGFPVVGLLLGKDVYHVLLFMVIGYWISLFLHLFIYLRIILSLRRERVIFDERGRHPTTIVQQLRYAFPIGLSSYVGVIGREMDKFFISGWFLPSDYAVYSRGAMEVPLVSTIRYTVNDMLMTKFVEMYQNKDFSKFLTQWHIIIELVAKINFGVVASLFILSPSLISVLYTDEYLGAVPVFRTYLFLLVIGIAVYGMIPRVSGNTKLVFWASMLNLPINIALSFVLIDLIGVVGPAIATVVANFITMGWLLLKSVHLIDTNISKIFPWRKLFMIAISAIMPALLIFSTEKFNVYGGILSILWIVTEMLIYFCFYIWLLNKFKLLSCDEISTVKRWARPFSFFRA